MMTPTELWALIQATPACAAHIVPSEPKATAAIARAGDQAIADILNTVPRTKVIHREIGDGMIALALGTPDGPVFLYQLEMLAMQTMPNDATAEQIAQYAVARQVWRSITKASLDVGAQAVREGIQMFVGTLLTEGQARAILALAELSDPITAEQVSRAVRGPRE